VNPPNEPRATNAASDELEMLVAACVARMDVEGDDALERFCASHPDRADALRGAVASLRAGGLDAAPPAARETPRRRLGDFEIRHEIGRGGMGVVYAAEQLSLRRTVALKVLPGSWRLRPAAVQRFQREALTAARLKHPSIVEVHAVGSEEDVHYFAMELVEGAPLDRWIERRKQEPPDRRSIEKAVRIVAQVADALEHAHRSGVVHRDVKPSNVIVRDDGTPVLTDFGLAREAGLPSITETGEFAGTPDYVSPEQALARRGPVDHRTDVFSLGVTLYECLTLERPFFGETRHEVLDAIRTKEPRDPQKVDPNVPADLATITLKALEKEPSRRYATAGAMADDLRAFLEYRPIAARRASAWAKLRRWTRREPAKAALAAALAAGVPSVALLAGYVVAKRPAVRAAAEQAHREELERRIEAGFLGIGEESSAKAGAEFDAALAIEPESVEAIAGAAFARLRWGDPASALQLLARHEASVASEPALQRIRADALRAAGRASEADELELRAGPARGPVALFVEGARELFRREGKGRSSNERALELLTRSVVSSGRARAVVHFLRAEAAFRTADEAAARQCAEAIPALWPQSARAWYFAGLSLAGFEPVASADLFRRALALDPTSAQAYEALGAALMGANDTLAARDVLRRAIELAPQSATAWSNLGLALRATGDPDGSMAAFRRAAEVDADSYVAQANFGASLLDAGDVASAMPHLSRAIELNPANPRHWNNLGRARMATGDVDGAISNFRRAISLAPNLVTAHCNLGNALWIQGAREESAACYRRALEIDPTHPDAQEGLRRALGDSGDPASGGTRREALEAATRLRPNDAVAWNALASFLLDPQGSSEEADPLAALAAAKRAVEFSTSRDPACLDTLAEALFRNGDVAGAIESEERALSKVGRMTSSDARKREGLERSLARYRSALPPR